MSFFNENGKTPSESGEGNQVELSNAIDSDSTTIAASSLAVKRVNDKIETKADKEHNHDEYYTKTEIDNSIDSVVNALGSEQYKIKAHPDDAPSYLFNKLDNITLSLEGSELKVRSIDGLLIGVANINSWLSGTTGNIQDQINGINSSIAALTSGMKFVGKFETYAELQGISKKENGDLAVVLVDENRSGGRSMYVYSDNFGMWDFIGEFTFTDSFTALKDTPSNYTGADGKVLKVDELNKKLVFSDIDYSELRNKPTSTITQIDSAVTDSHSHSNLPLLNTYTHSNTDIANAVNSRHTHSNKSSLDKLDVNAEGQLTINGVVYAPKPAERKFLHAYKTADTTVTGVHTFVFDNHKAGTLPYNKTTGHFTVEQGKTYVITCNIQIDRVSSDTIGIPFYLIDALRDTTPAEAYGAGLCSHNGGLGSFTVVFTAQSTRDLKIRTSLEENKTYRIRERFCNLTVYEI